MEATNQHGKTKPDPFFRRAMYGVFGVIVLLVGLFLWANATMYWRIHRVNSCGGVVLSWSPTMADRIVHWFGAHAVNFYEDAYVLRDQYQVFYGNAENSVGCGVGLSLWSGPEKRSDCGDDGLVRAKELPNINRLSLIDSAVSDDGLRHIVDMKSLRSLDLQGTLVKGPGLVHLQGLPLTNLSLRGTPLQESALANLPVLPELVFLDLGNTGIDGKSLSALKQSPLSLYLDLSGTRVKDEDIAMLIDTQIGGLNLYETDVTDAVLEHLERMPNLQSVHLCHTKVTLEAARRSKNAHVRSWVTMSEVLCRHTPVAP